MNIKKLILFFVFFMMFQVSIMSSIKNKKLMKNELVKNIELKKEDETLLEDGANRILQVLDAFALFEQYSHIHEIHDSFVKLLKNFFGLSVKKNYNTVLEKQFFIESIILSLGEFNTNASTDLKYLCDMQLKYILGWKSIIINKIKKKSVYSLIVLSYYYYLFYPNEYINLSKEIETNSNNSIDLTEQEINWQEASLQLPLEFAELGILNNGYLYELYDKLFIEKLSSNKEYNDILLIKKILPDAIAQDDFALERLIDKYKKNINFFKKDLNFIQFYQEKQEFFLMWLLEKKNIVNTLDKFFNEDSLFVLFTIVLLYKSILRINIYDYYPLLSDDLIKYLEKFAKEAEFILCEFFYIFDKKAQIDWNNLPIIIIGQKRLNEIIKYLKAITVQ
jgi:hypothetical protein